MSVDVDGVRRDLSRKVDSLNEKTESSLADLGARVSASANSLDSKLSASLEKLQVRQPITSPWFFIKAHRHIPPCLVSLITRHNPSCLVVSGSY